MWLPGGEDPLKKEMASHCSILASEIPWREEPGGCPTVLGVTKSWIHLSNLRKTATYIHIDIWRDRQKDRERQKQRQRQTQIEIW